MSNTRIVGYVCTWHCLICPGCSKENYLYVGDIVNDMSFHESTSVVCWNCNHAFDFEGNDADPDDADDGKEFPA